MKFEHCDNFTTGFACSARGLVKPPSNSAARQFGRRHVADTLLKGPKRRPIALLAPADGLRTRNDHLAMGPVFEISDCKAFEKWVGFDELLSIGSAGCVGAGHNRGGIGIL